MDYLVVAVVGFLAGGFAIPVGFALDLAPLGVYLAAVGGSGLGMAVFLFGGDRLRAAVFGARDDAPAHERRLAAARERGPRWLGLVGPTFPGVTASCLLALAAGIDPREVARWMTVGIAGLFAVYTVGLALIVG